MPLLAVLVTACVGGPDPEPPSRALLTAPPGRWAELLPPVLDLGPAGTPALVACLRDGPDAPGSQAVVFALGESGDPAAVGPLTEIVEDGGPLATEAALGLGKLAASEAVPLLRRAVGDKGRGTAERTAAAAALLDLGAVDDALPFIEAVLLAGTPAGRDLARTHGLPSQLRWAHERWMAIQAIGRLTGGETFGLDPDSSWPRLEAGVAAMRERLAPGDAENQG